MHSTDDLDTLAELMKTARHLAHVLGQIPPGTLTPEAHRQLRELLHELQATLALTAHLVAA